MGKSEIIGYNPVTYWAYCEKCDHYFTYSYNAAKGYGGDYTCPKCKHNEGVITEEFLDIDESVFTMALHHPIVKLTEKRKETLNKRLSLYGKLRNKFKEMRENRYK